MGNGLGYGEECGESLWLDRQPQNFRVTSHDTAIVQLWMHISSNEYRLFILSLLPPSLSLFLSLSLGNHHHLFLQGSDRLYLNVSRRHWKTPPPTNGVGGAASRQAPTTSGSAGNVSSPQWKVIQLPLSYLVLNWPIKVCTMKNKSQY